MDRLGGTYGSYDSSDDNEQDFVDDDSGSENPPSPVGQDERRMQVRAYNHWASLLSDKNFPSIEDLEPETLDDFGPYSVLLDFSTGIEDPAVQFLGDKLAEECDAEGEIGQLSDVPSRSLLSRITDHYMQILANQAPIGFEAEFVNQRGLTVLYRGILLPYSSDDKTINFIYGVINWKEMADQETADELLLEIGQALDTEEEGEEPEIALDLERGLADDGEGVDDSVDADEDEGVLDLADLGEEAVTPTELPVPAFGSVTDLPFAHDADEQDDEEEDEFYDYGLGDLEDEPEIEDVDEVVDPLADDHNGPGLNSLVSRGDKPKITLELPSALSDEEEADEDSSEEEISFDEGGVSGDADIGDMIVPAAAAFADEETSSDEPDPAPIVEAPVSEDEADDDAFVELSGDEAEGLYDCLASAREAAQFARSTEDRSRKALYQAVGRAYDFSLEAEKSPEDFAELITENGLSAQERAPMTPVVKLVFGADYDKTRLTEYAAVLSHAHRVGVERGELSGFLSQAEGGLKGVVQAERRARREEAGKPVEQVDGVRESLAKKLREIDTVDFADIDDDGAEFALVMIRRLPDGSIAVVGEVPEDVPLVERAARKILA